MTDPIRPSHARQRATVLTPSGRLATLHYVPIPDDRPRRSPGKSRGVKARIQFCDTGSWASIDPAELVLADKESDR